MPDEAKKTFLDSVKDNFLIGALDYLSNAVLLLKANLAADGEADEQTKKAAVVFLVYEQELGAAALKSETKLDDKVLQEVGEAARAFLDPNLVNLIEGLHYTAPPDVTTP